MNREYITCRNCGASNLTSARYCTACGNDLHSLGKPVTTGSTKRNKPLSRLARWFCRKQQNSAERKQYADQAHKNTGWLLGNQPDTQKFASTSDTQVFISQSQPSLSTQNQKIQSNSISQPTIHTTPAGQRITNRYVVLSNKKNPGGTTIYYDAIDLICPNCERQHSDAPPDSLCANCHTPLRTVLIHERQTSSIHEVEQSILHHLLSLGQQNHPAILFHHELLFLNLKIYSVVRHPGRWGYLVPGSRTMDEIIAIITQIGKALTYLHQHNYTLSTTQHVNEIIESWIALPGCNEVRLADLSTCKPIIPVNRLQCIAKDIDFLAKVLHFLTSGLLQSEVDPSLAPLEFRPFLERVLEGHYLSPLAFMQDLSGLPASPIRQVAPSHGQATHPGKKHENNEDAIITFTYNKQQSGKAVPIGFYLVADGMGGHDAGDLASRTVNQIVTNWVLQVQVLPDLRKTTRKLTTENIPAEILNRAIEEANTALLRYAQLQSSNLGSTVTAALIIGDTATIVNVGDSRTYRLRNNQLVQITRDHSIVARLVETSIIAPEEIRSHPRRNEIYRNLGHDPGVEIDTYTVTLQKGDRLILCSDGLWEMVLDEDIKRIIQASRTSQEACDTLINAANSAGGEDNISVIVVEME